VFRKKCQSAEEFFKTQTIRYETQLWKVEVESSVLNGVKKEPFEKSTMKADPEEDFFFGSFGFHPDEIAEVKVADEPDDESFTEEVVGTMETKAVTRNVGFRRRSKKQPVELTKKKISNLKCQYCGITLSRRNRLIQHERLHLLDQTQDFYECFFCGKFFNQKFGLVPHFKTYHNHTA
jgi:hypothetical protein